MGLVASPICTVDRVGLTFVTMVRLASSHTLSEVNLELGLLCRGIEIGASRLEIDQILMSLNLNGWKMDPTLELLFFRI